MKKYQQTYQHEKRVMSALYWQVQKLIKAIKWDL